jgi:hypothetical protein
MAVLLSPEGFALLHQCVILYLVIHLQKTRIVEYI